MVVVFIVVQNHSLLSDQLHLLFGPAIDANFLLTCTIAHLAQIGQDPVSHFSTSHFSVKIQRIFYSGPSHDALGTSSRRSRGS